MTRYKSQYQFDESDPPLAALVPNLVTDGEMGPKFSDLYDQYGNPLYRLPEPVGFRKR